MFLTGNGNQLAKKQVPGNKISPSATWTSTHCLLQDELKEIRTRQGSVRSWQNPDSAADGQNTQFFSICFPISEVKALLLSEGCCTV